MMGNIFARFDHRIMLLEAPQLFHRARHCPAEGPPAQIFGIGMKYLQKIANHRIIFARQCAIHIGFTGDQFGI